MKQWILRKLGITQLRAQVERQTKIITSLEAQLQRCESNVAFTEKLINNKLAELKEYTSVDADVGVRGNNTIILTGVMHGKGYVKFWDLGDGEFRNMAHQLRDMQQSSLIRNIDSPPSFNFRGVF